MNVNSDTNLAEGDNKKVIDISNKSSIFDHAPLAAPEDDSDELAEYAQIKEVYSGGGDQGNNDQMYPMPHDLTPSKSKSRHRRDKEQSKCCFTISHTFIVLSKLQ